MPTQEKNKSTKQKKNATPTLQDSAETNACVLASCESEAGTAMTLTRHFALCGYWDKHVLMTGGEADMRATDMCVRISPRRQKHWTVMPSLL